MSSLTQSDHAVLAQLSARTTLPPVSRWAVQFAYLSYLWSQRRRTRAQLRALDPARLQDIGLTPDEARLEYSKWFWRP